MQACAGNLRRLKMICCDIFAEERGQDVPIVRRPLKVRYSNE